MKHLACVSDFCGNHTHPGAWADLYEKPDGTKRVVLGGGWDFYGEKTPEFLDEGDPHFAPFLSACEAGEDFGYARKNWN